MKQPIHAPKINAPVVKGQAISEKEGRKGSENSHHNGTNS